MKKLTVSIVFVFIYYISTGQSTFLPTDSIRIFGLVEKPISISLKEIQGESKVNIDSFQIKNHKGEVKRVLKNIKAVRLKDILKNVTIKSENPRVFSEYYLVARASDGYAVVLSWNELFNNVIGNSFFIITSIDDIQATDSMDRIIMLSTTDIMTGRRFVKGLASLEIKRI